MRKYLQHLTVIIVLLFAAASCKKDDAVADPKVSQLVQTSVIGVNGPVSGKVNQALTFSIVWQNADGTAKFDHIKDSTSANTKFIKLFALTNVVDTADIPAKELSTIAYKFKATTPGIYYLKFYKKSNDISTVIIDTLNIVK